MKRVSHECGMIGIMQGEVRVLAEKLGRGVCGRRLGTGSGWMG